MPKLTGEGRKDRIRDNIPTPVKKTTKKVAKTGWKAAKKGLK